MTKQAQVIPRRALELLRARLEEEPVISLCGPRTVGKSTLLAALAGTAGAEIIDLDDVQTRAAVSQDPAFFVSGRSPVLIDEFQYEPALLSAIKAELNRDLRPGRFVLAGSTRFAALPKMAQSLTGRLHILPVMPLSQDELAQQPSDFLSGLLAGASPVAVADSGDSREELVQRIVRGGLPLALARHSTQARDRWFSDYLTLVMERDVVDLARIRQRAVLPRVLQKLASQTAQVLNAAKVARLLHAKPALVEDYTRLLEAVYLIQRLPAWGVTLRARGSRAAKLHVVDSGIAAHLLRLSAAQLASKDPTALEQLGHLLESFAVNELLKQAGWCDVAAVGHWRTHDGDEVDLVVEAADGRVVAFEIKLGARVGAKEMRGLKKLRDALGRQFSAGVLLTSSGRSYRFEDRLFVAPVESIWRGTASRVTAQPAFARGPVPR